MSPDKRKPTQPNNSVSIGGDVVDSVVVVGNNNQTFFQKVINIFKSDTESLEQRNRRILLGHVENAWIKGVLDASLHGAALLDLGIKQDPESVTQYPWAIKKESTDETLPTGTSMLEIFDSIGMGRSLLILGAPGSGKTTMLLELARGLIARAREDVTQPIPMVFNLASWTEKLTLADWLAHELNNLYSVPRKTAPDWVKGNKLLLLLDGLDEVRQESRAKCVEAINEFRKQNGLTSLAVCSRSQDYADLNAKLSFEGAIEVQPLTQGQIAEFFNRFGDAIAGIKQVLKKDSALREMAETPLFLSIMILAYRDKQDVEILVSGDEKARRKHLFDNYIERIFERPRSKNVDFKKHDVLDHLSWLTHKMMKYNQIPLFIESVQPHWLGDINKIKEYNNAIGGIVVVFWALAFGVIGGLLNGINAGLLGSLFGGLFGGLVWIKSGGLNEKGENISTVDTLSWSWVSASAGLVLGLITGVLAGLIAGLGGMLIAGVIGGFKIGLSVGLNVSLSASQFFTPVFMIGFMIANGLKARQIDTTTFPGQRLVFTAKNFIVLFLIFVIFIFIGLIFGLTSGIIIGLICGLSFGIIYYGGNTLLRHYTLRFILARNNLLPWRLVPFLDHCVDLIFLRRVGGGYIFIHRLLMEHFAEMYVETPTSKEN